jgi:hypothetical protein
MNDKRNQVTDQPFAWPSPSKTDHSSVLSLKVTVATTHFIVANVGVAATASIIEHELASCLLVGPSFATMAPENNSLAQGRWDLLAALEVFVPNLKARLDHTLVLTP